MHITVFSEVNVQFNKINKEAWNRAKTYDHYMTKNPCTYSMCVNIDISKLLVFVKKNGLKFFPVCLYGISHSVNQHQEFRMAIDEEGHVGYFDVVNPCYTVFHSENELVTNVWTEYNKNFKIFYNTYENDMSTYIEESKPVADKNIFNVSCIPWVSFTGLNLNLQKSYDYLPPIFTIGKYYEENKKKLMPLAIQVHHAVCDGFHIGRFVNELQEWADNFSY